MNRRGIAAAAILGLTIATARGVEATNAARNDVLVFRNGDFVYGKLLSVTTNEVLRWQHPDASAPIQFTLDGVEEVDFANTTTPERPVKGECKVVFANGDLLRGKLAGCDADTLTLDVAGAGRLKLPRVRVQSLAVTPTDAPLIDGLTGMDGWTEVSSPVGAGAESGHWTYRDGAFYASKPASVARIVPLPDMARIEFDLAWRGQPNIAVAFYTDSLQPILLLNKENGPDFGGFYSFRLSGIIADIYPIKKHGQIPSLGSVILSGLDKTDHAHFDFRMNKAQNRIILLIDKAPVMQWADPNGFEGEGKGIRFVENSGAVKLSNLRIMKWDGILEEKPDVSGPGPDDVVWLQNGQSISGTITGMNEQSVNLKETASNKVIPFASVREIDFKTPPTRPVSDPPSLRALCAAGGGIHGYLESWTSDGVILRSPDFGRAKFPASMFAGLQFLQVEGN